MLFNILRGNIDNWVFTIGEGGAGAAAARAGEGGSGSGRITIDTFKSIFGLAGAGVSGRGKKAQQDRLDQNSLEALVFHLTIWTIMPATRNS